MIAIFWVSIGIAIFATFADAILTYIGLKTKRGSEGNKLTRWFIKKLGLEWGLFAKAIVLDLLLLYGGVGLFLVIPGVTIRDHGLFPALWALAFVAYGQIRAALGWYEAITRD